VKLHLALDDVQRAEMDLAAQLRRLAEHHATEHDVYHLGHALAEQCAEHVVRLRPFVERYHAHTVDAVDGGDPSSTGIVESLRQRAAAALGRVEIAGLALLRDLRDTYLTAQLVEIDWAILEQAAKAVRDPELLAVVSMCHEQAEHTAKWLRTRIKVGAAQVLATS
jgi:hypothetical protein